MEDILETLNQGVLLVDPEGVVLFANQVFGEMVGMEPDDLFGATADEFYCGSDLDFLIQRRAQVKTTDQYEFFLPRVEGKPIPVIIAARRISSPDGLPFAVVTFTDITEQKETQKNLHRVNKQLEEHRRQLDTELALAARVQRSLEPRSTVWNGVSVEAHYEAVHTIGGDFGMVAPMGLTHLNLLVCDVSGHGIGSALIANRIYTETVSMLERQHDLGAMLHKLNRLVIDHVQLDGFFFTMAAARMTTDGHLSYASAGHPPAILLPRKGGYRMLEARNGLLGLMEDAIVEAPVEKLKMSSGDRLLLTTDGLTEVFNEQGQMLGSEGLARIAGTHTDKPLNEMKQAVLDDVAAWRYGPVTDDVSLVLVEIK